MNIVSPVPLGKYGLRACSSLRSSDAAQGKMARKSAAYVEYVRIYSSPCTETTVGSAKAALRSSATVDGHTLQETVEQIEILTDHRPKAVFVDKGYRGATLDGIDIWRS
ncbi:MAG: hypothetical protein ACYC3A_10940, partial [Halothiobacillus sp.]